MNVTAYNTATTALTIDSEGHSIGGGAWGTVDDSVDEVKAAVERGDLVCFPDGIKSADASDEAKAAQANTDAANKSAKAPVASNDSSKVEEK